MKKYKQYGPLILRLGISFVFLWFGLNQILYSSDWVGWLPIWISNLSISENLFVILNGGFEVVFGLLLLFGIFTRIVALLLSIHLLVIAFNIGYNDVGVRDFGLAIATLSLVLIDSDNYSIVNFLKKR